MIAERTGGFDDRLAPAISAEDPSGALQAVRTAPESDPQLADQVRAALELIDDLSALRERIDRTPVPPLVLPKPTDRPRRPLRWIAPAAGVAAAVVLAIGLLSVDPPPGIENRTGASTQPVALTVDWDVPALEPISLAEHEFSAPEISLPSLASLEFTWTVPSLDIPSAGDDADGSEPATRPAASSYYPNRRNHLLAA